MAAITETLIQDSLSPIDRGKQWLTYHFDRGEVGRIADELKSTLEKMPRLSPKDANQRVEVLATRRFFKIIAPRFKTDEKVRSWYRQFQAAKLGIEEELFKHNPGFFSFAKQHVLERYLMEYEHALGVDGNQILIRHNGELTPWKEIPELEDPEGFPMQKWVYGQCGIQKQNMFHWEEWTPYKVIENHDWGDRYIFEMCVCCEGASIRVAGDHVWFRLKTPTGEVYSVSKNLESKLQGEKGVKLPFRAREAFLMSPDVSEFYPTPIYRAGVEITKKQFEAIVNSVNQDKKNEKELHIQVLGADNCVSYTMDKAKLAGIEIPTSHSVFRVITPEPVLVANDFVMEKVGPKIKSILQKIGAFFGNLLMLILGNGSVDSNLKKRKVSVKPRIHSMADMVKPEVLHFHPPTHFKKTIDEINEWQRENNAFYKLPEQYIKD